jgi:Glycosyl transferases group 1/DUF based on E. rectale Gene description (DUF3880)
VKIALLTMSAEYATSEYFVRALESDGHSVVRIDQCAHGMVKSELIDLQEYFLEEEVDGLFFIDPPGPLWPTGFENFRKPKYALLIDVHQNLDVRLSYAPFFDVVFVAQKDYVSRICQEGFPNTFWLPLGCDPEIHRTNSAHREIDVGFVGKLGSPGSERYQILNSVLPRYKTNDYRRFYSPREMGGIYCASKIGFNASINGDLNMRAFEVMAAGALLVTDRIKNGLEDILVEGEHYIGYSSVEEALEKIDYYLDNATERECISRKGQAEVLEKHTYITRWRDIERTVYRPAKSYVSPIQEYSRGDRRLAYSTVYRQLRLPRPILAMIKARLLAPENFRLVYHWIQAIAKSINARYPVTPGAIKARYINR